MPNLPLGQEVYLIGVICAFSAFILVLAYGRLVTGGHAQKAKAVSRADASAHAGERHAAE